VVNLHRILLVDDEPEIRALIRMHLQRVGFDVLEAETGRQALEQLRKHSIDLIILDLMLDDDMTGVEVLQYFRQGNSEPLVLVLSARGNVQDKVDMLGLGADDYITKPFSPIELVARVQAQFRRHRSHPYRQAEEIHVNDLVLHVDNLLLQSADKQNSLTEIECRLLQLFMRNPDRILTKREIYKHVWNHENYDSNNLSVFISRLRTLLGDTTESSAHLKSIRGVGYRFSGDGR